MERTPFTSTCLIGRNMLGNDVTRDVVIRNVSYNNQLISAINPQIKSGFQKISKPNFYHDESNHGCEFENDLWYCDTGEFSSVDRRLLSSVDRRLSSVDRRLSAAGIKNKSVIIKNKIVNGPTESTIVMVTH